MIRRRTWAGLALGLVILTPLGMLSAQQVLEMPEPPPEPVPEQAVVPPDPPVGEVPPPKDAGKGVSSVTSPTPAAVLVPPEPEELPKPPLPLPRLREPVAILQVVDKVTTETLRFEAPVGGAVRYRSLTFEVKACESTAPDEPMHDSSAYLIVTSTPMGLRTGLNVGPKVIFKGWAFASSPGLNALEHPVYDAWVISCSASDPVRSGT